MEIKEIIKELQKIALDPKSKLMKSVYLEVEYADGDFEGLNLELAKKGK